MIWLWIIGLIVLTLFAIYTFIEGNADFWSKQGIVSVRNSELGTFWERWTFKTPFHLQDFKAYEKLKSKQKDLKVGGLTVFRHPLLFICDLDLIRHILVKDFDHFMNRRVFEFDDSDFKSMLINLVDQEWKDLRNTMSPTFTTGKIRRMFGIFDTSGRKMVDYLRLRVKESGDIEMQNVCGRYTMDVIAGAAFGVDSQNFEDENSQFAVHGRLLQFNFNFKLLLRFVLIMMMPKLGRWIKLSFFNEKGIKFLNGVMRESIRRRKELGEKRDDFLQLMLEAQNDQLTQEKDDVLEDFEKDAQVQGTTKYEITDEVIIAQCNLFFFAGFDTTETLLIWAGYELALSPEIQERLFEEINEAAEKNGGKLDYDTVVELKYLEMVVSETLRKYSPGIRLERNCNKDFQIPDMDFVIKKGTHVGIPIYAIHHDPDLYPNPEQFDPERFNAENKAARHPYAYMPFGLGPRNCIAMRFALMEGRAALAHLILNFRLSPCSKTHIPMKFSRQKLLKPADGMWLNLETRQ